MGRNEQDITLGTKITQDIENLVTLVSTYLKINLLDNIDISRVHCIDYQKYRSMLKIRCMKS